MTKFLLRFAIVLTTLALSTDLAAREIALRAECFDETGDGAIVRVYEMLDMATGVRRLTGVINFPNGKQIQKSPLRFREAGVNAIWRGNEFLLRVHTNNASSTDLFLGRFRGRDDNGNPIILRSLSCDLSGWAGSER
jgi:hypothetical protein